MLRAGVRVACLLPKQATDDEHAVLCTASKTFSVKMVDISNTMYLCMPQEDQDADGDGAGGAPKHAGAMGMVAQASVAGYIELLEIPPNIG